MVMDALRQVRRHACVEPAVAGAGHDMDARRARRRELPRGFGAVGRRRRESAREAMRDRRRSAAPGWLRRCAPRHDGRPLVARPLWTTASAASQTEEAPGALIDINARGRGRD
jgi:hypothetical protein